MARAYSKIKYTLDKAAEELPISLTLVQEECGSVRLEAQCGTVKAELMRFTNAGTVALIVGQSRNLQELGFEIREGKLYIF